MNHFRLICLITMIMLLFLLSGCSRLQVPQDHSTRPASATQSASTEPIEPTEPEPTEPAAEKQTSEPKPDEAKEANWVIEIDDTQKITDEMGLIWNYTLSMYASKAGGKDSLGIYTGEMILNMEPDFDSAKALAAKEGTELLAMLFKHHSEAKNITFEVIAYSPDEYAKLMKENLPDSPLLPVASPNDAADGAAITRITFEATQEPIDMTIRDEDGTGSGTIPGRKISVTVPVEITIEGATAFCFIYKTVHPLDRAFKGILTGDVLN